MVRRLRPAPAGGGTLLRASRFAALAAVLVVSLPDPSTADPDPLDAMLGEALFEKLWVASPSSTKASDGLGPLYNARACAGCHAENGRGVQPQAGVSDALIASFPDPDPIYGAQIQTRAVQGQAAEAALSVQYMEQVVGGVTLRDPSYELRDAAYGPVSAEFSVRLAPPLAAMRAMEAVPEAAILAWADPEDVDGDGISGRVQPTPDGRVGRFGYKGHAPRLARPDCHGLSS